MKKKTRLAFGYKLFVSYLLLVMIPLVCIGLYSYISSVNYAQEQARANVTHTMNQARDNMLYQMSEIQRISDQMFWDSKLQELLDTKLTPYESYMAISNYIQNNIASALNLTDKNIHISLYFSNERIREVYHQPVINQPLSGKRYAIYHMDRIVEQDWYTSLPLTEVRSLWRQVGTDQSSGQISLIRNIVDFRTLQQAGVLRVRVNLQDIFSSVSGFSHVQSFIATVVDENGQLLYPHLPDTSPEEMLQNTDDYLTIKQDIPDTSLRLLTFVPLDQISKEANQIRNITILICLLSFLVLVIISWYSSKFFSRRLTKLLSSLRSFTEGEFSTRIRYKGNDEFADITAAFNDMAQNIDGLIGKVYISQMKQKEAELAMLQAHINPHFLYNTLSSINQLAKLGKFKQQSEMILGLSKFYRLTLSEGKTIIPINQELEQVRAYVDIQQIKHMDALTVSYDIDEDVMSCDTVKLILQPFVENALEHAWFDDRLHIRIMVQDAREYIGFKVIDNGVGMRPTTIQHILDNEQEPLGYGIRNVDERIKLQYGDSYGVRLYGRPGMGTAVIITIPKRYKDE